MVSVSAVIKLIAVFSVISIVFLIYIVIELGNTTDNVKLCITK